MGRSELVVLMFYVSIAFLARETDGQIGRMRPPLPPTPLCASQFALVNHACKFLPYSQVPPPAPLAPHTPDQAPPGQSDSADRQSHHHHRHHHHHHHHHHHRRHDPSPLEADCCRWLSEVDSICVCDLLVHLPAFLAKPVHEYTVAVPDACNVTYTCPGRLRPE